MEAFEAPRKGWDHVGPIFIHIPKSLPSPPIKWTATTKAAGPGRRLLPAVFSAQKFLRDAFRVVDFMTNLLRDLSSKPLNRIGVVLSWFALFHSEIHPLFFLHHKNWVLVYGTIFLNCVLKVIVLRRYVILPRPRLTWIRVETLTFFWFHHVKVFWIFLNHVVASNLHERHTLQEASFSRYLRTVYVAHFERVTLWWSHGYCGMLHLEDPRFAKHGP